MEAIHGSHKAFKLASGEDVISKMPENVITNILERLPIQNAVRTGILSTNWRFNWNMLTQLVFDYNFFKVVSRNQNKSNIISGILFQLKGSVTKFVLRIPYGKTLNVEDLSLSVMFLSRKGIKEFTLLNLHETPLKLPTHLFSCLELKQLNLQNCLFHPPPSFHGFPNLWSLHLMRVRFESYKCGELITRCPLLTNVSIVKCILSRKVKVADIAKLSNLLFLALSLCSLEITPFTTSSIFQFVGYFPKLQELHLDFRKCKDLSNKGVPPPAICSSTLDGKTMVQLQLRSVVFSGFRGSENEVCLIKSLLACSPLLKTMRIGLNSSSMIGGADGKFRFANKLLKLYRASPLVEIDLL